MKTQELQILSDDLKEMVKNDCVERLDILNREAFVERLLQLVENISQNKKTATFAIDGSWGCGKSFVLDMFEKQLEVIQSEETCKDKYLIVRYNCWKYDYYEEPLIAIVAVMLETINSRTKLLTGEQREKIKGILNAVGTTLVSFKSGPISASVGVDLTGALKVAKDGMKSGEAQYSKMQEYDMYFAFNQVLHSLQEVLDELGKEYTIVILVDELDRCLPEYAIKVLERLHHLTETTENVISVIAIDKAQLKKSVGHIFGFQETEQYLKKFIQFTLSLDVGCISDEITEKHAEYIELFDKDSFEFEDSIEEFMQAIFQDIDVREQERIVQRTTTVHNLLFDDCKDYSFMCMELLITVINSKYKDIKVFSNYLKSYTRLRETEKEFPPFDTFFEEKFKSLNIDILTSSFPKTTIYHLVVSKNSLYNAIFYMWCKLFLITSDKRIGVSNSELATIYDSYVEDLKRFYDTMKIIG